MARKFKKKINKAARKFHRKSAKRARTITKLHIADTIDLIDNKRVLRRLK